MPQVYQACFANVGQLAAPQECDGFITRDERGGNLCKAVTVTALSIFQSWMNFSEEEIWQQ